MLKQISIIYYIIFYLFWQTLLVNNAYSFILISDSIALKSRVDSLSASLNHDSTLQTMSLLDSILLPNQLFKDSTSVLFRNLILNSRQIDTGSYAGYEDEDIDLFGNDSIWDSDKINPYRLDASAFKDTLKIMLYDTTVTRTKRIVTLKEITYFTNKDTIKTWESDTVYERNNRNFALPISSTSKTSNFGYRWYRYHYGTDLQLVPGTPVYSVFDGVVRLINNDGGGYGNFVVIKHYNGLETLYGHLTFSTLDIGKEVKAGQMIGYGGSTGRSTGPHLHFEIRYKGIPINPEHIFDFDKSAIKLQEFQLTPAHFQYQKELRAAAYHTIKPGNTLSFISKKYRVPVTKLCQLNNISTRTILRVGRKIRVR